MRSESALHLEGEIPALAAATYLWSFSTALCQDQNTQCTCLSFLIAKKMKAKIFIFLALIIAQLYL